MKLLCKGTIVLTCIAITACSIAEAQVTTYLDPLRAAVTQELTDTNLTAAQKRALKIANKALAREAESVKVELVMLASAANALNKRFEAEFVDEQEGALASYLYDATNQLADVQRVLATNPIPRNISQNLARATNGIAAAQNAGNSIPVRARALGKAFTKLGVVTMHVLRSVGLAPASLESWSNLDFYENAIVNDQTTYYFVIDNGTYNSHNPEELGLWSYQRANASNGLVTVMPNWPSNDVPRDFTITFTNFSSGTFTGTNQAREFIQGRFFLSR